MDHIAGRLNEIARNIEIVGADLVSLHGFTQVPNFILTNKDLSVGAKLYYAMLLKYAREKDYCFPGQQTLANDMGSSERSVRTYQKELEDAGFLEVTQRGLGKSEFLQARPHGPAKGETPGMSSFTLPAKTGNRCLSERQNLPVTQYNNTHLIIHK